MSLTETRGREHPRGHVGRDAVREDGLQDVAGEGEGDDGQRGRVHDEDGAPQQEEPARGDGRTVNDRTSANSVTRKQMEKLFTLCPFNV